MKRQPPPAPAAADLDFKAAIEADAEVQLKRLGFDDKFGRKRLHDLVHEAYVLELMTIAQMTRWFEIGLVTPQELRQRRQAARGRDRRAWGRWSRHGRLL